MPLQRILLLFLVIVLLPTLQAQDKDDPKKKKGAEPPDGLKALQLAEKIIEDARKRLP